MRKAALLFAFLVVSATFASAEEPVSAFDVTERNRTLDRILDNVICPVGIAADQGRLVLLLIDPTVSLRSAHFDVALRSALHRNAAKLGKTWISVMDVDGKLLLSPTDDRDAVADTVADLVAAPRSEIVNIYAATRQAAARTKEFPGGREVVLVSLENGDAEDRLEKTVEALREARVRLSAIAREAFLSDTWWYRQETLGLPGCQMEGAESAFIEMPWQFLLQRGLPTEAVASGFALFGITRLAAATGGKVWLHYPRSQAVSRCSPPVGGCSCPHCLYDHESCGETYQSHRLRAIAPLIGPRREVGRIMTKDPYLQVALGAWHRAASRGIILYESAMLRVADGIGMRRIKRGHYVLLGDSIAFDVQASRAMKLARACETIITETNRELQHAGTIGGHPRFRALAETIVVMLRITRFNLRSYAAFCREVGPKWEEQEMNSLPAPEVPALRSDYIYARIGFTSLSLCHGLKPYARVRFPGGRDADLDLAALADHLDGFFSRHGHTPFAQVVRRQSICSFNLGGTPKKGLPAPRWIPAKASGGTATQSPSRPARAAPASGGSTGTPTSGGR